MDNKRITLQCDCKCCMLVIDKYTYDDMETDYNISMQSSYYKNPCSLLGRIKGAFLILFGKPVYYNDAYINKEQMQEFYRELTELIESESR